MTKGGQNPTAFEVVAADLTADAGRSGCRVHARSPCGLALPDGRAQGRERVDRARARGHPAGARAAAEAGVARVVLTVIRGHRVRPRAAEHAVHGAGLDRPQRPKAGGALSAVQDDRRACRLGFRGRAPQELAVVNPVGILGPPLGGDPGHSVAMVSRLLDGMPGVPNVRMGLVDVRDVADLHVRAMTHPEAPGQRFLAVAGHFVTFAEVGRMLRESVGERARKVPTRVLPDWLVKLVGRFDPGVGQLVTELGTPSRCHLRQGREGARMVGSALARHPGGHGGCLAAGHMRRG